MGQVLLLRWLLTSLLYIFIEYTIGKYAPKYVHKFIVAVLLWLYSDLNVDIGALRERVSFWYSG